jgi:diacylglycerol kinase (ATP)
MKLLLVVNPRAAHGRARQWLQQIRDQFEHGGMDATVVTTESPGHAKRLVAEARLQHYDGVAAAGGDGTLFESLNGLMTHLPDARPPLGLIPLGTGNAFSRDIGLAPGQWREGVELIARGKTRRVDVGLIKCGSDVIHFLNIAGVGFVSEAGKTSARLKFAGRMAYTLGTLWQCLRLRSYELKIDVDGTAISQNSLFIEVSNSRYTGTSFLIAPDARIDDGLLDVVWVRDVSRLRLLRLFPSIYSGRHVEHEEVAFARARVIEIQGPPGLELMVDGELRGITPARIECLPGAIEMFAE